MANHGWQGAPLSIHSTLRQHLARHGLCSTLGLLILQPLENLRVLRIGRIHVSPTTPPSVSPLSVPWSLDARFLSEDEVRELVTSGEDWFFPGAVEKSLRRGERCFALFANGSLATTIWYSPGPLEQFGLQLTASPNACFAHRRYTRPEWRGRNLATWASLFGRERLCAEGVNWTIGTIYTTNASSIAQSLKTGAQRVGWIFRVGPDSWNWSLLIATHPHCREALRGVRRIERQ